MIHFFLLFRDSSGTIASICEFGGIYCSSGKVTSDMDGNHTWEKYA